MHGSGNLKFRQGMLFEEGAVPLGVHGTFQPNREEAVHRWYPYLEGFSNTFVQSLFDEFGTGSAMTVYEPFAGSGTTPSVAATGGHSCLYSEINPFMQLVIWAKTEGRAIVAGSLAAFRNEVADVIKEAALSAPTAQESAAEVSAAFPGRPYFDERRCVEIVGLRRAVLRRPGEVGRFLRFMLGAIAVESSELKRAGDLRYRTAREKIAAHYSAIARFRELGDQIYLDCREAKLPSGHASMLSASALDRCEKSHFADLVVTSPPYINGTNYIRNAKLELWAAGLIGDERELRPLRAAAVTSGICDVMKNGRDTIVVPDATPIIEALVRTAYDRRIPEMVARYFSDATIWIGNVAKYMRSGGRAIIDIGDSRFGGVHVPADLILASIGQEQGLLLKESRLVRPRRSKDGSPLHQVLLVFEAP